MSGDQRARLACPGSGCVSVVECIECPSTARYRVPCSTPYSEVLLHFQTVGWSVQPTMCPRCLAGLLAEVE